MLTVQVKLSVEDITASLDNLDDGERKKLQYALYDLQNDTGIDEAIKEAREDIKNGRVHAHEDVMREIKAKYMR
jgi:predicted transcriptional regulator